MLPTRKNQGWLPSIFNDFFDNDWMEKANATAPAINVVEHENDYCIEVAAPGMTKDDFQIHIDDNDNLVITMEKKSENKEERKKEMQLKILLENSVNITSLSKILDVSRVTIKSDLLEIEDELKEHKIFFSKNKIYSEEKNIRNYIMSNYC